MAQRALELAEEEDFSERGHYQQKSAANTFKNYISPKDKAKRYRSHIILCQQALMPLYVSKELTICLIAV